MQFPAGLLLLTFAFLLHEAYCETTEGPKSVEEAKALADAIAEAGNHGGSHLGDVVVDNGEETEPDVEKSDLHHGSMEAIVQEIEEELLEDGVKPNGNFADVIEELGEEYENGTLQGIPTYHHTALDVGHKNTTHRRIGKRQADALSSRWEKGILPYTFNDTADIVSDYGQERIKKAMKFYEDTTCLRFPLLTSTVHADYNLSHSSYLRYVNHKGCYTYVGRTFRSGQPISCCDSYSTAIHEIAHALGLLHEQDRANRDLYVALHPENATPEKWHVFGSEAHKSGENVHPYDYGSRMHYIMYAFSKNDLPTLTITDKTDEFLLGNRETLFSHYDLMGVTKYYECTDKCPAEKKALKCENDGFVDVHCKCKCSALFTGDLCEKLYTPPVVTWPTGSYGLPDSMDGCPTTGTWSTGSRTHAMESWSYDTGSLRPIGRSPLVNDYFCMKSDPASGSGDWPAGTYCIYQQGDSCPTGFQSGSVTLDDDNERSGENTVKGSLPKGVYTKDTQYFYCCRSDGSKDTPIHLPREKTFFLFGHIYSGCQSILGMAAIESYRRYDQEDTSPVTAYTDPIPFSKTYANDIWMYYCYYRPINYDCGGIFDLNESKLSINISSPNYPQNYNRNEECIWYIKGPKDKHMVLDVHDLELEKYSNGQCLDTLELRDTLVAQLGEKFCGKGPKSSVISNAGFFIMVLRAGRSADSKGFSSTVRLVSDSEHCYNTEDRGSSYRGEVDYSQLYHKCLPWDQVQHCPVNKFASKYIYSGLTNAYCRNPNNLLRPWCYINNYCGYDFCDVCGLGKCYDISTDCAALTAEDPQYCSTDDGFRGCHKTCNFCGRGHEKPVSSCTMPVLTDKNAVIAPSQATQTSFEFGEKLKIECKEKIDEKLITREITCTTDGKFEGNTLVCCAGTACEDGYSRYKDACYKFVETKEIDPLAQKACVAEKGNLVGIADDAENNFVKQLIGGSNAWIGIWNSGGGYVWDDEVTRNYTHWRPNEPSSDDFICTIMEADGTWNDIDCWDEHKYVCKKDSKAFKRECSCEDEDPECTDLIRRNYKVCKKNEEYSFTHCRSSCGLCGAVADCKNPGTVANTVQKTTIESTTTGNYFEYECSSGYGLVSGNLGRTCLKDGTLSGTVPVCEPYIGNVIKPRQTTDDSNFIESMIVERSSSMTFTRSGSVRAWKLFSNSAVNITMVVVRPVTGSDSKVTIVGNNDIKAPNRRTAIIPVPTADRISVEAGDIIAWYYLPGSNPTIPLSTCNSSDVKIISAGKGPFTVGQEVSGTVNSYRPCRTYSIGALLDYGDQLSYSYVGNAAVPADHTDGPSSIEYMYIERSSSMTSTRSGSIIAWKLYSNSPADITMIVVRPVEGSDKVTVIGMNDIKAPNGKTAVMTVPTADRISVEAGDIIAWYYLPGSNPTIAFSRCSLSDVKILWAGKGPFTVGQEVSGTVTYWKACRTYSISALLVHGEQLAFSYVGNGAVPAGHTDGTSSIEYMYIERSSSMTFTRAGSVKAWELFSNSAANITLIVVRPGEDSDTEFTIVGMNDLKTPNGKTAIQTVATADRISVKAGDIIAWYYLPGSDPTIAFSKCSSSDVKIIWAGKGPFAVGQEVSGTVTNWKPCRTYSIGAILDDVEAAKVIDMPLTGDVKLGMMRAGPTDVSSPPDGVQQQVKGKKAKNEHRSGRLARLRERANTILSV